MCIGQSKPFLKIFDDLLLQPKNGTEAYKLCSHMLPRTLTDKEKASMTSKMEAHRGK